MMRIEGETSIRHNTDTFRLRFDMNVLIDFQDHDEEGRSLFIVDEGVVRQNVPDHDWKAMRLLFWLCFRDYHPEVTLRQAGAIMSADAGHLNAIMNAAIPDAADDGGSGGNG